MSEKKGTDLDRIYVLNEMKKTMFNIIDQLDNLNLRNHLKNRLVEFHRILFRYITPADNAGWIYKKGEFELPCKEE